MATFEEQFPSLKGHTSPLSKGDVIGAGGIFILKDFVEESCLDKQRVREVIKLVEDYANMKYSTGEYMVVHDVRMELIHQINLMKKELRL